jgi:threonine dehydrogenase-like Zn-dependent dehydrogenase
VLEIQAHRAEFAKTYCADQVFINPPHNENETTEEYSQRVAKDILTSVDGLYRGFDVVVEAAGALECMQIGLQVCRPGGTCKQYPPLSHSSIELTGFRCSGGRIQRRMASHSHDGHLF